MNELTANNSMQPTRKRPRAGNAGVVQFYRGIGYAQDEVVSLGKRLIHDREPAA